MSYLITDREAWLKEVDLERNMQRNWRQKITSLEIPKDKVFYVLDNHAVEKANNSTKEWIQESMLAGDCVVVSDESTLSEFEVSRSRQILRIFNDMFPNIVDKDVITSLHAYLFACNDEEHTDVAFVTGNERMLNIVVKESPREELYRVARIIGFSSPCWYMFIDGEGLIQRANLKWDDPTRPSHQRVRALAHAYHHANDTAEDESDSSYR